jgi:hypothetical protein
MKMKIKKILVMENDFAYYRKLNFLYWDRGYGMKSSL